MWRAVKGLAVLMLLAALLVACGGEDASDKASADNHEHAGNTVGQQETVPPAGDASDEAVADTRTITYLGEQYELPANVEKIVITGAVEAMEDAIVIGVNPVGAISFSGEFPPMFQPITEHAVSVGEKTEPNFEAILSLQPDVILGSTKFPEEVTEKLRTIGTTILYSHISTNWEANLRLLGELGGKEQEAEEAIAAYKSDLEQARVDFGDRLQDKKVVVVRVRGGSMYVYPANVYFNPVLYEELGLSVPAEIEAAQAQEMISIEKFAEMNPDYVFLQFSPDENKDTPNAMDDLQNNPILQNVTAFKEGHAFVNVVDPLAQGGTAYSKIAFLKEAVEKLTQ